MSSSIAKMIKSLCGSWWAVTISAVWAVLGAGLVYGQAAGTRKAAVPATGADQTATLSISVGDLQQQVPALDGSSESSQGLFNSSLITPPDAAAAPTVLDAIQLVVKAADRRLVLLSTNVTHELKGPYEQPFPGRAEYDKVLDDIVPFGFDFWERPLDQNDRSGTPYLFLGTTPDINRKRIEYDTERLAANHTRIPFVANGISLSEAVQQVGTEAGVNINTAYMDDADRVRASSGETNIQVSIGTVLGTNTIHVKTVTLAIPQKMEWRHVLTAVLDPFDYAFDEKDGMVRVARKAKFKEWQRQEVEERPLGTRIVRIYHANPDEIVEKITSLGVTCSSNAKIMVAPFREACEKNLDKSSRLNLTSSSSTLSTGAGSAAGDTQAAGNSSWGDLLRPKNPPAIILRDIEENLELLEELVRSMDAREKQVLIEALVLDLNDDFIKNLGVNWNGLDQISLGGLTWGTGVSFTKTRTSENSHAWRRDDAGSTTTTHDRNTQRNSEDEDVSTWGHGTESTRTIVDGFTDVGDNKATRLRDSGTAFTGMLGPLDFNAVLNLVHEDDDNRVLSSPVLTIGDHSEAMIHVGTIVPYANIETSYLGENNDNVEVDVEWMEIVTGILIWVGPEISKDGKQVRLWVHPKLVELTGTWEIAGQTRYPHMTASEMDTRVTVPSGNTLLLGGLTRVENTEIVNKVPFLGDIPLLGRLFRNTETGKAKRNLVILIRPTILDETDPDTGFEVPTLKITDPMMSSSGRNLSIRDRQADDKMIQRERRIFGTRTDEGTNAVDTIVSDAATAGTETGSR